MTENRQRRRAPSPRHPRTEQHPEDDPVIRIPSDDGERVGPVSNWATRSYTFGRLLADLKRNKPIRKGKVNFFDEHQLRTECARRCAADLTHESVVELRNGLCRKMALSPTEVDAMDAQAVIDLICDITRLSPELAFQELTPGRPEKVPKTWQDAVAHNQYLIDYIHLGMGVWQPVSRADCIIVEGKEPNLCPDADPVMPADFLRAVEDAFRQLRLLKHGQTVHWVGVRSYVRERCRCFGTKPAAQVKPRWDGVRLWLGEIELRSYQKKAAPEQALVLAALENAGWPSGRVTLPESCRLTLHVTLNRINARVEDGIIQLQAGGDGKTVLWRPKSKEVKEVRNRRVD